MKRKYLDPDGCRCTDCVIGVAVPLDWATQSDIRDVKTRRIENRTGLTLEEIR